MVSVTDWEVGTDVVRCIRFDLNVRPVDISHTKGRENSRRKSMYGNITSWSP